MESLSKILPGNINTRRWLLKIDWQLLIFLLLFMDVKLWAKVMAIVFIYLARPGFKFGFRFKSSRLSVFYLAVIGIAVLDLFFLRLYLNLNYAVAFLTGLFFWLLCILASHQLKLSVETKPPVVIENTLIVFFALNAIFSLADILKIIVEIHAVNPYRFQGLFQKYFIGTGDYIKGIFFDTSTTNAVVNAFGVIYFLRKNHAVMALVCMMVLLATGSNTTNILLLIVLATTFIFKSNRYQKSIISICVFFLILFLAKVSPQNNQYAIKLFRITLNRKDTAEIAASAVPLPIAQRPDSLLNPDEKKQKIATLFLDSEWARLQKIAVPATNVLVTGNPWIRPALPQPDINDSEHQSSSSITPAQQELISFAKGHEDDPSILSVKDNWQSLPGKIISLQQTVQFFKQHPAKLLTGNGMGNFSSKLAFRTTALNIAGGYPKKYTYIDPGFMHNHLAIFLYYFTKRTGYHSVVNTPDSVYDQLLSEYGLAGVATFLIFYAGFFCKKIKQLSYGRSLLFIMAVLFCLGYWFEQLSVVVLFELMMFIDMQQTSKDGSLKRQLS